MPNASRLAWPAAVGLGLLVLTVLLRWPAFDQPLDRDSGLYALIGQRLLHGDLPYRDFFDHKQPLVYVVYALIELVSGGPRVGAVRLAAAGVAAVSAGVLVWGLLPHLGRVRAGTAGVLTVVIGSAPAVEGVDLNTEHLLVLPATAAVAFALRGAPAWMGGMATGLAILAKSVGVLVAPVVFAAYVLRSPNRRGTAVAWLAAAAGVGLLAVLPFVLTGALDDFLLANWTYNRRYVETAPPPHLLPLDTSLRALLVLALAAAALHLASRRGRSTVGWVLVGWLVASVIGAAISGHGFPHYYATWAPAAAATLVLPFGARAGARAPSLAAAVTAVLIVVAIMPFARGILERFGKGGSELAVEQYGPQAQPWTVAFDTADALRQRMQPGDRVLVLGSEPEFYWAAEAVPPTRFAYDYPAAFIPDRFVRDIRVRVCPTPPRFLIRPVPDLPPAPGLECLPPYREVARVGVVTVSEIIR